MPARGKFIVLEGIDGSGKQTQMEMLARAFSACKTDFARVSFPRYEGFFGKMVAQFLNGEFGPLDAVDPHFSALLYAGDRLESKCEIETALASGKIVLADRYIGSNLAHQGARVNRERRPDFLRWLEQLEYKVYGLPKEDLVIYLHVPARTAQQLVGKKAARAYTKRRRDLQESNLAHLKIASQVYDDLSQQPNWMRIECLDVPSEKVGGIEQKALRKVGSRARTRRPNAVSLRTPEAIHEEILRAIHARVVPDLKVEY